MKHFGQTMTVVGTYREGNAVVMKFNIAGRFVGVSSIQVSSKKHSSLLGKHFYSQYCF